MNTSATTLDKSSSLNTVCSPTNTNVRTGEEVTKGLLRGIKTVTSALRLSYGAKGTNASVQNYFYPYAEVVNDAQTIIQAIEIRNDPLAERGLNFTKELSDKAHKDSGDGRKTTCILAEEILERGIKISGNELKRELDAAIPLIEAEIDANKRKITVNDVHQVATIASESEELGKLIGDTYKKIGKDGVIHIEGSGTYLNDVKITEGIKFTDTGYLSPAMAYDLDARKDKKRETLAIYENPTILVTKRRIGHINDINPLLEALDKMGKKDLVIFTDDMDSDVARLLVDTHKSGQMHICIIKAPVIFKQYVFEDFAKVTGSTIVEDASGINFRNLQLSHLGTCKKIVVDKEETTIVGGSDISEHIKELKAIGDNDSLLRLQWLQTKTAIIKLGANNESELSYKRLKCHDAVNSSRLALQDGVVAGGGVALFNVSKTLPNTVAGKILRDALQAPLKQILVNAGFKIVKKGNNPKGTIVLGDDFSQTRGYDVKKGKFCDVFEAGIVDSAKVVKNAVRNAISLASTVATVNIDIHKFPPTSEQVALEIVRKQGLRF